ncbi:unnamed protein product [Paramecium pentaurelia]|uniref:Ubiquitin carboxyl-terminal hydrolase n=1 Tax=Paramecium pentaurelia TaxID=43138 RepID=A0A8S1WHK1_9CILI|nr:unnamed protein product [Paramecium pentaurelia]
MGTNKQLNRSFKLTSTIFDQLLQQYSQIGFKKTQILQAWQQCGYNQQTFHEELIKISEKENALIMNEEDLFNSQIQLKMQLQQIEQQDLKIAIQLSLDQNVQQKPPITEERINKSTPVGLKNLGNTCYMNAMLQSLFNVLPFRKFILELDLKNNQSLASNFLLQLQLLFLMLQESNQSYINPYNLFDALQKFKPSAMFIRGVQNDFNELQNSFQDAIEQALKEENFEQQKKQFCEMFYGEAKEILSYKENDKEIIKFNDTTFGSISIEAADKDLEKGFLNTRVLIIDEYETENKEKTKAKIDQNIVQAPFLISFYINRVYYDPKQKQVCKNNTQFNFNSSLNINQFKTINQGQKNLELQKLDQEEQRILDQLKNFGDTKEEIEENFNKVIKLFKRNEGQIDNLVTIDGFCICDESTANPNIIQSDQMLFQLESYKEKMMKTVQLLTDQLERIQEQKKKLLKSDQNMYLLTSVLMHDGSANSGHYYCYVLDKKDLTTWWKCNDSTVTKVDFAQVYKDASGSNRVNSNVSGLVYEQEQWLKVDKIQINQKLLSMIQEDKEKQLIAQDEQKVFNRKSIILQQIQQQKNKQLKYKDYFDREFERFSNFDQFLNSVNQNVYQYYLILSTIQQDILLIKDQLNKPQEIDHYIKYFITQTNLITINYDNELKKSKDEYLMVNSLLQQLPLKNITNQNYSEIIRYYYTILKSIQEIKSCSTITNHLKKIYGVLLLKGCFFVDLSLQTNNISTCIEISQSLLIQINQNEIVDKLIFQQVFTNLKLSSEQAKLITKKPEIEDQIIKIQKKGELLINLKQLEFKSLESEIPQLQRLRNDVLKLWIYQYDKIKTEQKLLDQNERQNAEVLLYFG